MAVVAPSGCTATGMTVACEACSARFPPGLLVCPRCGGVDLVDLGDPRARRRYFRARMKAESPNERGRLYGAMAALGGAAVVSIGLVGAGAGAGAAMGLMFLIGMPAGQLVRSARETRKPRVALTPVAVAPSAAAPTDVETVTGSVRLRRPVVAPVAGRGCAAWRVTGVGPSGPIDDAAIGGFDVFREGGPIARVDAEHAFVDLGQPGPLELRHLEGAVARVMRARGRVPDHASCAVAECLLAEGDSVEVTGRAVREIVSGGLRDAPEVLVFREWPTVRLVRRV